MAVGVNSFGQTTLARSNGSQELSALGAQLWRKKWWILWPTVLATFLAMVFVNVVTPKYKSEARVLIETRENIFYRPEAEKTVVTDRATVDLEAMTSQAQLLLSRDLARQVITELKLAERPEFDPVLRGVSLPGVVLSLFGLGRDPLRLTPEERVLANYYERLIVSPIDKSRVIIVEFQSEDPELAARVTNAIVDAYLARQQAAKQEQTRSASQWLATEIEKLRPKVAEAEANVENFRSKANLFVGTGNANLGQQQLTELTTQLSAARAQKAEFDAKSRLIRGMLKSGKPVESADIVNSDLLKRLIEQRVTLRSQFAEQSSTLLDLHPRIQELNSQIRSLDTQIRAELEKLVRSLENDAVIAAARIETTNAGIDRIKKQIASASTQDVELRALEREAKAQRDLLESYLGKYREATARDSLDAAPADARVISRARPSNLPAFPKKLPIVLIAALATAFIAISFIVSGALLSQNDNRPAGGAAGAAPAVSILDTFRPRKSTQPAPVGVAASVPIEQLAQALHSIGEAGRRITVVGTARNVGTTYTALGLARALAAQGARVVLVDLALGAPNLSIISTDPDAPGFAELVRGSASFGSIITRDKFSRVHLVTTGKVAGEGPAILASPRLTTALEGLARTYDHVVIDAGAVPEISIETFARLAPRAVLVATDLSHPATLTARERLIAAGFTDVTVFLGQPHGPGAAAPAAA